MIIVHISIHIKPDKVEDFKEVTLKNARKSVQEPGIVRFDIIQQEDDPKHFLLEEMYRNSDAIAKHKDTTHYAEWRDAAEPLMSEPRKKITYIKIFPDDKEFIKE
jgi:(4S)-4-hydroxy-5-phosphonooxypentane-2,3-dione isomerase